jgi:glyoxylase-like metal-dependent hydrolase (beta-lactamase superfamily II)
LRRGRLAALGATRDFRHGLLALVMVACVAGAGRAQDGRAALDAAAAALGIEGLRSVHYSGWGSDYVFGQAYDGRSPWPRFNVPAIAVAIDYTTLSWRDDRRRAQAENPPLGGGFQPLVGEQRQIWALGTASDGRAWAWDVAGTAAVPAAVERDMRSAVQGRMTQIWLTPHGFVKAALAGRPTMRTDTVRGARKTAVSVTTPTGVRLEGVVNEEHLIERIETWFENPVLGDVKLEASFGQYKDFGGVKFPTRILHRLGGYPVLDVIVTSVTPNAPAVLEVPASIREAAPPVGLLVPERIADGIWIVPGSAKSVVVEFRDHVVVIDAPETEARSLAVIEAVKKSVPGKPIRYVINTHAHFDHAGGLRTYAAEGAIVITEAGNVPYYEQVWANPRTIGPDRLARSGRKAVLEGVVGSRTFRDESREMVVYHYAGNMHNAGMLMAYLPRERVLIEADSFTPAATPDDPPGGVANLAHFYDAVDRLRLDVEQIVPMHGRLTTLDEARAAVEMFRRTQIFR